MTHHVLIYKPAKTAMQSGRAKTKAWVLVSSPHKIRYIDPLMHWTGAIKEPGMIRLSFDSAEDAVAFATARQWTYRVLKPQSSTVKPKSYADNFLKSFF